MRVLLVDDNADSREMYAMVLQADGHEVYEAEDGAERAAQCSERATPDVAIIDIGLPGMDGYELARRIRSEPDGRDVTLIALTGYGFPEDRERSTRGGLRSAPGQTSVAGRPEAGVDERREAQDSLARHPRFPMATSALTANARAAGSTGLAKY